ncbi:MAG: hypothetical protein ACPG80_04470, partial [Rickettsiales bacterium]
NALMIGAAMAGDEPRNPFLSPEEAWNIDTKLDDGRPGQGSLWAYPWGSDCNTASGESDHDGAEYALNISSTECALIFPGAVR